MAALFKPTRGADVAFMGNNAKRKSIPMLRVARALGETAIKGTIWLTANSLKIGKAAVFAIGAVAAAKFVAPDMMQDVAMQLQDLTSGIVDQVQTFADNSRHMLADKLVGLSDTVRGGGAEVTLESIASGEDVLRSEQINRLFEQVEALRKEADATLEKAQALRP